ncbi:MAG: hypothetical protein QNL12_03480 [Acidimicrobiia bacterium]|nr:hypothetical protein [Acidimicrobiia bacterium]
MTDTPVAGFDRDYYLDESGTLEHLLEICQDAALGAGLAAKAVASYPEMADFFERIAAERNEFSTHLALLLEHTARDPHFEGNGTFRGKLFHWRLRFAAVFADYLTIDGNVLEATLGIARHGAGHVLKAYEEAEGRPLSTESRREVHRQAEHIRTTSARIYELAK